MADASWKEENFQVAAHVIANSYNKRVETANSLIMNQYAGSFHMRGRRRETNNLVCVALYDPIIGATCIWWREIENDAASVVQFVHRCILD